MRRSNQDTTWMLREFFTDLPGKVSGIRSSYWLMVERAQSGLVGRHSTGDSDSMHERAMSRCPAARRESDIAGRLEQLTVDERVVLSLAFGPSPWPVVGVHEQREDRRRLGEHPGVALVSQRAQRAFLAALAKRERRAGEDERPVLTLVEGRLAENLAACERTDAWRRGEDPRAGVKAMLDRGFVDWLRGPTISDATLGQIRDECAGLMKAAVRAWEAVAPRPDAEGRVRHDQRRRAAYGPASAVSEDGDRISDVYVIEPFALTLEREVG